MLVLCNVWKKQQLKKIELGTSNKKWYFVEKKQTHIKLVFEEVMHFKKPKLVSIFQILIIAASCSCNIWSCLKLKV